MLEVSSALTGQNRWPILITECIAMFIYLSNELQRNIDCLLVFVLNVFDSVEIRDCDCCRESQLLQIL